MTIAFLSLGSNIGNRERHIDEALLALNRHEQIAVIRVANYVESKADGGPEQGDFLNTASQIQTDLLPMELLAVCQEIEEQMGRKRIEQWGPRIIDIDIILYGEKTIRRAHLKIPHPRMHERWFVLFPLCQIASDARHPRLRKTARQLLDKLEKKMRKT